MRKGDTDARVRGRSALTLHDRVRQFVEIVHQLVLAQQLHDLEDCLGRSRLAQFEHDQFGIENLVEQRGHQRKR
jgi:hypothetical protein